MFSALVVPAYRVVKTSRSLLTPPTSRMPQTHQTLLTLRILGTWTLPIHRKARSLPIRRTQWTPRTLVGTTVMTKKHLWSTVVLEADFDAITEGVPNALGYRTARGHRRDTLIGPQPECLSIMTSEHGVLAAGSRLYGRVGILGPRLPEFYDRSTLRGIDGIDTLVKNAVKWASGQDDVSSVTVKTDNDVTTALLAGEGGGEYGCDFLPDGLWTIRAWDAAELEGVDVVVA